MTGAKAKENYYYYTCAHHRIRKELLEQTIADAMRETVNDDVLEAIVDKMLEDEKKKDDTESKKASLREIEKALSSIRNAIEQGFDAASMMDRYNGLIRKRDELEAETKEAGEMPSKKELMDAARYFMEVGDDRDLVTLFLDRVVVDDDALKISFRIFSDVPKTGKRKTPPSDGILGRDLLTPLQTTYTKFLISVMKTIH